MARINILLRRISSEKQETLLTVVRHAVEVTDVTKFKTVSREEYLKSMFKNEEWYNKYRVKVSDVSKFGTTCNHTLLVHLNSKSVYIRMQEVHRLDDGELRYVDNYFILKR